jgi:DNA-directed RNA polymerase subunit RPC12/RpoP
MAASLQALILRCNRCGHEWLRRMVQLPQQCPACHSKFWNRERVRAIAPERRAKVLGEATTASAVARRADPGNKSGGKGVQYQRGRKTVRRDAAGRPKRKGKTGTRA